jgi:Transmembrane domain of unknown function (DUF3566)
MTTTAEEPTTHAPGPDPVIDVELGSPVQPSRADRSRVFGEPRRTKVTVRRFGLLSVFRFSLLMSFCMMLVIWLALLIIFLVLQAVGVTDTVAEWIGCLVNDTEGTKQCTPAIIDGARIFTWLLLIGCVFALIWTALAVFFALLYNLISDIVGGVEVTLSERRR